MPQVISTVGLFCMVGVAWLLSSHRYRVSARIVVGGLALQFLLALFVLQTQVGRRVFEIAGDVFNGLLDCVNEGSQTVFGITQTVDVNGQSVVVSGYEDHFIAFKVLPTIIFFSAFMAILYHLGIVQLFVRGLALLMQKTLGTSGAESLSAAANVFVGQTEAPLVVRPYIESMTNSELMSLMVGGFATIAGGVLAAYIGMGIDASHLLTASVISAPAALLIAKVMEPEVDQPKTLGTVTVEIPRTSSNLIEAAGNGTIDGLKLALNVGAMLIAFVALMAVANAALSWCGDQLGYRDTWTLERMLGIAFVPFAWLMGIPYDECLLAGELLGAKTILNEFVAYNRLGQIIAADAKLAAGEARQLSERSVTILTYALCGFANFSSIGIQLGGIGGIAESRRSDLARLGLRAMIGGTLAAFMTACIAGILL